jgi:hypothetical protein
MKSLPSKPSLDRSDPIVMNRAAGVAKRRNTLARRKLPLFADQLPVVTAGQVMDERESNQLHWRPIRIEMMKRFKERDREVRLRCRELCKDDEEFFYLMRRQFRSGYGLHSRTNRWGVLLMKLQRRLEPLSETAELVYAWMEQIDEPITYGELWRSCGDGLDQIVIFNALLELESKAFVQMCEGRPCRIMGIPFAATFLRMPGIPL